jgi:hypothetical protein
MFLIKFISTNNIPKKKKFLGNNLFLFIFRVIKRIYFKIKFFKIFKFI